MNAPLVLRIPLLALAASLPACAQAEAPDDSPAGSAPSGRVRAAPADLARWPALTAKLDAPTLAGRFVQATALFLGTPYADGPLGEGDAGGPDPDPRVCFDRADCVTYLEQSLALALIRDSGRSVPMHDPYLAALDRIRYRDGNVSYADRNHYTSRDWIPNNAWLLEDVTRSVAPGATVLVERTIDRAAFLRDHGAEPRPGLDDPRTVSAHIIPRESVAAAAPNLVSGDLVFWAGRKDGILIVHTGLAVLPDGGAPVLFRHASSKAGKVTEEPLADYAARAGFSAGFLVLRLREDAAP